MRRLISVFAFLSLIGFSLSAQPVLVRGDLLVSDTSFSGPFDPTGSIRVYSRTGVLKGTLIEVPGRSFFDLFERDGVIHFSSLSQSSPDEIARITVGGTVLPPFTSSVDRTEYISPGPSGGLLAQNGSGEVYQFAADGSLVHFRDVDEDPPAHGGIELASDGCTVYWAVGGSLVRWDACLNTPAAFITVDFPHSNFRALRLLPDGTFLVATFEPEILHLDASGNVIRQYDDLFGNGLALDIDGLSFWTYSRCRPVRIDIATGAILTSGECRDEFGVGGKYVAVFGEPRAGLPSNHISAAVPTLSQAMLVMLALAFAAIAIVKLRIQ